MARKAKVATSFGSYTLQAFLAKMLYILQCLTGNADYPTPMPDLKTFGDAVNLFATLMGNTPGKLNTANKKIARENLTVLANQLALYVNLVANGDAVIALTSGFSLTKTPQPVGVLPKPTDFIVTVLRSGTVKLSLKKIKGANNYCFEYATTDVKDGWITCISSKKNVVIDGLTSGAQYVFRVAGAGTNPTLVYSDSVVSYIL